MKTQKSAIVTDWLDRRELHAKRETDMCHLGRKNLLLMCLKNRF